MFDVWVVNGRANIFMKTNFLIFVNAHEHSGAIIAHLPRGGSISFAMGTHIHAWL